MVLNIEDFPNNTPIQFLKKYIYIYIAKVT